MPPLPTVPKFCPGCGVTRHFLVLADVLVCVACCYEMERVAGARTKGQGESVQADAATLPHVEAIERVLPPAPPGLTPPEIAEAVKGVPGAKPLDAKTCGTLMLAWMKDRDWARGPGAAGRLDMVRPARASTAQNRVTHSAPHLQR